MEGKVKLMPQYKEKLEFHNATKPWPYEEAAVCITEPRGNRIFPVSFLFLYMCEYDKMTDSSCCFLNFSVV